MKNEMRAWKVRADLQDEEVLTYLGRDKVSLDYGIHNLASGMSKEAIEHLVRREYLESSEKRISAHIGQIHRILNEVVRGDILVVPINKSTQFCIGTVKTDHPQINETNLIFSVKWLRTFIPINKFEQDLRYSFMAIMKICEIKRNSAASRLYTIASGVDDPGY
jgi:predicted Mrr-cat superfamily restriction endonuclease